MKCGAIARGPTRAEQDKVPSVGPGAQTYWWAILPLALALFQTTTLMPRSSESFFAMMRAAASDAPPAEVYDGGMQPLTGGETAEPV